MPTVIEKRYPFWETLVQILRIDHKFTLKFIDTQITLLWKNGICSWEDIYNLSEARLDKISRLNKKVRSSLIKMHIRLIHLALNHAYAQILDKYTKDISYGTLFIGSDYQAYFEEYFKEIFSETESSVSEVDE